MEVEFCIYTVEEARAARAYDVQRVELCKDLHLGGLTPSDDVIKACVDVGGPETHVLVRPRKGDFNYSDNDLLRMKISVQNSGQLGARGVVFGILNPSNTLDKDKNSELVDLSKHLGLEATFHRAFDGLPDKERAIEELIELGFTRVLTSCGQSKASEAIETFRSLSRIARGRIEIMAGGTIRPENAHVFAGSKIDAIHFSISNYLDKNPPDESFVLKIDHARIEGILKAIQF